MKGSLSIYLCLYAKILNTAPKGISKIFARMRSRQLDKIDQHAIELPILTNPMCINSKKCVHIRWCPWVNGERYSTWYILFPNKLNQNEIRIDIQLWNIQIGVQYRNTCSIILTASRLFWKASLISFRIVPAEGIVMSGFRRQKRSLSSEFSTTEKGWLSRIIQRTSLSWNNCMENFYYFEIMK